MRRALIGIIVGAFVAYACIFAADYMAALLYPLPAGVDPNTPAGAQGMVEHMSDAAKLIVVIGWCAGSLVGGIVAARLAHWQIAAFVVAAFVVGRAFITVGLVRHPTWLVASGLVLPWLCALLVQRAALWRSPRP